MPWTHGFLIKSSLVYELKHKYCIAGKSGGGKFGEFGESSVIHQTKTIQISTNLFADLLICQTSFCQMLKKSQTFPLYGT